MYIGIIDANTVSVICMLINISNIIITIMLLNIYGVINRICCSYILLLLLSDLGLHQGFCRS